VEAWDRSTKEAKKKEGKILNKKVAQ